MNDALHKEDSIITAYRAHGWTFIKGRTMAEVLCELTGKLLRIWSSYMVCFQIKLLLAVFLY